MSNMTVLLIKIKRQLYYLYQHPAWPRYEDKCPTCGNGKEADWEVFKYFPLYAK